MRRYGYDTAAQNIQELYLAGRKAEAAQAVPLELARRLALIGSAEFVQERLDVYAQAGVSCLLVSPAADSHAERLEQMTTLRTRLWPGR
jgi:hypothetical protein